jgi:excisionase family DNA binding protein
VRDSDYLTIEETAKKLGRPASWVTDQICEGKLGATLAGRQWLISRQDFDQLMLNNPPSSEPEKIVHNFLPARSPKQPHGTRNNQKASRPAQRNKPSRQSGKSSPPVRERRQKDKNWKPTLTQKIKELDREFHQLSVHLRSATLEYRAAIKSGKKVNPPSDLLRQWKTAKAELKRLIVKAQTKGLILPRSLYIYKVLAQEAASIKKTPVAKGKVATKKPTMTISGIEGYYGGPGRGDSQEVRRMPADVEARLIILRNRERAAAHSMRDRGKNQAARDVAAAVWAQTRREAERLERKFH